MLRDALGFLRNHLVTEYVTKHADRAEAVRFHNVPYAALEEALVNAIYHRSYEEREPVEVQITPEEVTILSFPGPDRTVQMEDLRAGRAVTRRYRNRRIGEFLKELELSEGRGTGIPKILRAMRANGSMDPVFETDADRLSFLVRLPLRPVPPATAQVTAQVAPDLKNLPCILPDGTLMQLAAAFPRATAQVTAQVVFYCRQPRSAREITEEALRR